MLSQVSKGEAHDLSLLVSYICSVETIYVYLLVASLHYLTCKIPSHLTQPIPLPSTVYEKDLEQSSLLEMSQFVLAKTGHLKLSPLLSSMLLIGFQYGEACLD